MTKIFILATELGVPFTVDGFAEIVKSAGPWMVRIAKTVRVIEPPTPAIVIG